MKVWLVCVVLFFGLAELYEWADHWVAQTALAMPLYGLAGLLLAVSSNSQRWRSFLSAGSSQAGSSQASDSSQVSDASQASSPPKR
ncbi:MAG: hypothetical protein KME07_20705 [Pegethrix bostrychoides GSE-TBD4-15B]|jgi:hypothetical protein|uniref:Uncharacterized protein n=1 Tax=Pegethrix bostrychoides GSE-TBD4-15B TaxID=2839662 RepID=A0A951PF34_9CYAN|nr:hypothetical protein [Pegethrix bostrychoides GSE-TBD4-15B]